MNEIEWISVADQLPPLGEMVEVKTLTSLKENHYWETHFETDLIRRHVLVKWRITHWKPLKEDNGNKRHKQIHGKY